jgi:hypothetical protein
MLGKERLVGGVGVVGGWVGGWVGGCKENLKGWCDGDAGI